jgi:hypothetical protein
MRRPASWGPPCAAISSICPAEIGKTPCNIADRGIVIGIRSKVPCLVEVSIRLSEQFFGKGQISAQWFKHMLPWTGGRWISKDERHVGGKGADRIRDQAVFGEIAAAHHISRPGCCDSYSGFIEEAVTIGGGDDFRARLAGAVGVISAEGVALAVGVLPLAVFVALVGRDDNNRFDSAGLAAGLKEIGCSKDIGLKGFERIPVGLTDKRLGGEVEDDRWGGLGDSRSAGVAIPHVDLVIFKKREPGPQDFKKGARRAGII